MPLHHFTSWLPRVTGALAATACILLVTAAAAGARPADNGPTPPPAMHRAPPPTVVRETVVQPVDGPDAIVIVLGAVAAAVAGGYLGSRVVLRATRVRSTVEQGR
jgi:hypothetical protein